MKTIAFDTETTALRRTEGTIFSYSLCDEEGKTSVHRLDGSAVRQVRSRRTLEQLWSDTTVAKVMHNAKFDLGHTEVLLKKKLNNHTFHDTMLMSHVLKNHHPGHALKDLAWELAGIPKDDENAIKPYTRGGNSYQSVPEYLMDKYQHRDAERCMLLFLFFWPKIQANKDFVEIYQNERDVIPVTLSMENRGVMLHVERCKKLITKLEHDAAGVLDRIEEVTGERIKPASDKARWYLYEKLKLPILGKTKGGAPKVTKEVLQELKQQRPDLKILDLFMMYTSWSRGVSMLSSYLDLADSEGVLHPNIRTCAAITGRESCADPNLQNVEKTGVLLNPFPVPARTVFRPRPGYVNFHLDYSGQEMRLLVHYSGDKVLVDVANTPGGDIHLPATLIFYGDKYRNADKASQKIMRNAVKNGNFAKAYGAQWAKIAHTLNLTPGESMRGCREYERQFPKLCALMPMIVNEVKRTGRIITAFGRHLHIPRDQAYMGVNYLIQGTAAEMLKRGQVRVHEYLERATGGELKLLLPIHDELIIECPRNRLGDAREILRQVAHLMTDFPGRFRVPLEVEVDVATTDWAHKNKFPL
jgi:DNA polymerase-1